MRTQQPYASRHDSDIGELSELAWPTIQRKPTIVRRDRREPLILPATNSMPLDAELAPVSTPAKPVAVPIATLDERKALWGSVHRSHTASMPRRNVSTKPGIIKRMGLLFDDNWVAGFAILCALTVGAFVALVVEGMPQ